MPAPLCDLPQGMGAAFAYHFCEEVTERNDLEPDALVRNIDTAFVEQILDIAQRQRGANIHYHGELNDFGRGFEVTEGRSGHRETLGQRSAMFKQGSFDTAQQLP